MTNGQDDFPAPLPIQKRHENEHRHGHHDERKALGTPSHDFDCSTDGVPSAFRFVMVIMAVLIFVALPDGEVEGRGKS